MMAFLFCRLRAGALLAFLGVLAGHGPAFASAAAAAPMGADEARHLLNRTGFEADAGQIAAFARLSRGDAVERILAQTSTTAHTPAPLWAGEFVSPRRLRGFTEEERNLARRQLIERSLELKGWWIAEMLATPSPLTERMTLFWHNHFTSSLQKVRAPSLLLRQNQLFRRHATGSFGDLLHAASKDPAMLVYLDAAFNRRGQPNENFAREVMELFTLGEGNFSETDVREAARAFTGWSIDPESGAFLWRAQAHDGGVKTVLGRSGEWQGADVLDILLADPRTAHFVVAKLWKEFVSPQPQASEVARIAAQFRAKNYDIKAALRALLTSEAFFAAENRGALIKSPVDLVIGTLRQFDVRVADPMPIALSLRQLGQDLFSPPNVKGWPGGEAWINSTTLLARKQFLERLLRVDESRMQSSMAEGMRPAAEVQGAAAGMRSRFARAVLDIRFSGTDWLNQFEGPHAQASMQRVLLAIAPAGDLPAGHDMDAVRRIVADPAYQLK